MVRWSPAESREGSDLGLQPAGPMHFLLATHCGSGVATPRSQSAVVPAFTPPFHRWVGRAVLCGVRPAAPDVEDVHPGSSVSGYPFDSYTVVITGPGWNSTGVAGALDVRTFVCRLGLGGVSPMRCHTPVVQPYHPPLGQWRDIWLHEGFACTPSVVEGSLGGPATEAVEHWDGSRPLDQDLVHCWRDPGPELMFDDRLYKQGALLLHLLRPCQ